MTDPRAHEEPPPPKRIEHKEPSTPAPDCSYCDEPADTEAIKFTDDESNDHELFLCDNHYSAIFFLGLSTVLRRQRVLAKTQERVVKREQRLTIIGGPR